MDPIPLRAHSLLCLLGFRGEGYSADFVREMTEVHRAVRADPGRELRILNSPDRLCGACPNLQMGGCTLQGPDHEAHMRRQDDDVIARLGLRAGSVYAWGELMARVAARVRGSDLPGICTTCPWLHLGWCAEGIERVREASRPS